MRLIDLQSGQVQGTRCDSEGNPDRARVPRPKPARAKGVSDQLQASATDHAPQQLRDRTGQPWRQPASRRGVVTHPGCRKPRARQHEAGQRVLLAGRLPRRCDDRFFSRHAAALQAHGRKHVRSYFGLAQTHMHFGDYDLALAVLAELNDKVSNMEEVSTHACPIVC